MEYVAKLIELWNDGWYWKIMIIAGIILLMGLITWMFFGKSYFFIEDVIESEYNRLSASHWFRFS
ncbi:hypothetical protein SAMN04487944_11821 [Gracilibacillus ureilyticus]|uniref:Uncharacterized protein n=1 Tax=Gracilibacillus ureilyticus TaxID=531814 RepID=A0A1H9UKM5_9BACI|nr:hypothetical protein SAMN04487944_11821 [Gracilibacillus ureilyticus]